MIGPSPSLQEDVAIATVISQLVLGSVPDSIPTAALQARFQLLVLPQLDRLVAFASRRLGNVADAEDVVQESCTRAWLSFGELRDETRVRPWLYRILRSALSDFRDKCGRREALVPMLQLDGSPDDCVASEDPGPFEHLVAGISKQKIAEALARLPEEFALAVELHDIEGFRYREIADITGAPVGTVMSRIFRGRRLLASEIASLRGDWDFVERRRSPGDRPMHKRQA